MTKIMNMNFLCPLHYYYYIYIYSRFYTFNHVALLFVVVVVVGAMTAVCTVSQHIKENTWSHDNYLQLCRVQKLLTGQKTKVLAAG